MPTAVFPISIAFGSVYTKAVPQLTRIDIPSGVITKLDVEIPSGVAALAGVQVQAGGIQLYPGNPNEWITGNGETVTFFDNYNLRINTPKEVVIKSYNLDDTFDHTLTVRFSIT